MKKVNINLYFHIRHHLLCFYLIIVFQALGQQKRPQTDLIDINKYHSEEVIIESFDKLKLYGTLSYPKDGLIKATVLLISGSGAQDRNSELLGHKPFLLIADKLNENGYAVLRMDDRGIGKSGGNHNSSHLNHFEQDIMESIHYLKRHPVLEEKAVVLLGHSMGGILGPMIAQKSDFADAVVCLAGPVMRGDKLMLLQKEKIERKMGFPENVVKMANDNFSKIYDTILRPHANLSEARDSLTKRVKETFKMMTEPQVNQLVMQFTTPWLYDMIRLDPKEYMTKLQKPVLMIYGGKDLQVPAKENEELAITYFTEAENMNFEIYTFDNHNHLFQNCETGLPSEYEIIEETMDESVINRIIEWLNRKI